MASADAAAAASLMFADSQILDSFNASLRLIMLPSQTDAN